MKRIVPNGWPATSPSGKRHQNSTRAPINADDTKQVPIRIEPSSWSVSALSPPPVNPTPSSQKATTPKTPKRQLPEVTRTRLRAVLQQNPKFRLHSHTYEQLTAILCVPNADLESLRKATSHSLRNVMKKYLLRNVDPTVESFKSSQNSKHPYPFELWAWKKCFHITYHDAVRSFESILKNAKIEHQTNLQTQKGKGRHAVKKSEPLQSIAAAPPLRIRNSESQQSAASNAAAVSQQMLNQMQSASFSTTVTSMLKCVLDHNSQNIDKLLLRMQAPAQPAHNPVQSSPRTPSSPFKSPAPFRPAGLNDPRPRDCYNCGELGHLKKDCPNKRNNNTSSGRAQRGSRSTNKKDSIDLTTDLSTAQKSKFTVTTRVVSSLSDATSTSKASPKSSSAISASTFLVKPTALKRQRKIPKKGDTQVPLQPAAVIQNRIPLDGYTKTQAANKAKETLARQIAQTELAGQATGKSATKESTAGKSATKESTAAVPSLPAKDTGEEKAQSTEEKKKNKSHSKEDEDTSGKTSILGGIVSLEDDESDLDMDTEYDNSDTVNENNPKSPELEMNNKDQNSSSSRKSKDDKIRLKAVLACIQILIGTLTKFEDLELDDSRVLSIIPPGHYILNLHVLLRLLKTCDSVSKGKQCQQKLSAVHHWVETHFERQLQLIPIGKISTTGTKIQSLRSVVDYLIQVSQGWKSSRFGSHQILILSSADLSHSQPYWEGSTTQDLDSRKLRVVESHWIVSADPEAKSVQNTTTATIAGTVVNSNEPVDKFESVLTTWAQDGEDDQKDSLVPINSPIRRQAGFVINEPHTRQLPKGSYRATMRLYEADETLEGVSIVRRLQFEHLLWWHAKDLVTSESLPHRDNCTTCDKVESMAKALKSTTNKDTALEHFSSRTSTSLFPVSRDQTLHWKSLVRRYTRRRSMTEANVDVSLDETDPESYSWTGYGKVALAASNQSGGGLELLAMKSFEPNDVLTMYGGSLKNCVPSSRSDRAYTVAVNTLDSKGHKGVKKYIVGDHTQSKIRQVNSTCDCSLGQFANDCLKPEIANAKLVTLKKKLRFQVLSNDQRESKGCFARPKGADIPYLIARTAIAAGSYIRWSYGHEYWQEVGLPVSTSIKQSELPDKLDDKLHGSQLLGAERPFHYLIVNGCYDQLCISSEEAETIEDYKWYAVAAAADDKSKNVTPKHDKRSPLLVVDRPTEFAHYGNCITSKNKTGDIYGAIRLCKLATASSNQTMISFRVVGAALFTNREGALLKTPFSMLASAVFAWNSSQRMMKLPTTIASTSKPSKQGQLNIEDLLFLAVDDKWEEMIRARTKPYKYLPHDQIKALTETYKGKYVALVINGCGKSLRTVVRFAEQVSEVSPRDVRHPKYKEVYNETYGWKAEMKNKYQAIKIDHVVLLPMVVPLAAFADNVSTDYTFQAGVLSPLRVQGTPEGMKTLVNVINSCPAFARFYNRQQRR